MERGGDMFILPQLDVKVIERSCPPIDTQFTEQRPWTLGGQPARERDVSANDVCFIRNVGFDVFVFIPTGW